MTQARRLRSHELAIICLALISLATLTERDDILSAADRNYQAVRVMHAVPEVYNKPSDNETSELNAIRLDLERRASTQPKFTYPYLITLYLWANDLSAAQRWMGTSTLAWQRIMDSEYGWDTLSLIRIDTPSWNYPREMIVEMAWLAARQLTEAEEYSESLRWFQRGISLAPGRIPNEFRSIYYHTLSLWYSAQPDTPMSNRLAEKFECLADNDALCLESSSTTMSAQELPDWIVVESSRDNSISEGGWLLWGLDLDEHVIEAGIDVAGTLYWLTERAGTEEIRRQPFIAPNLAPNAGFEFRNLFAGACVDGYVGSHAFVLPCVSQVVLDETEQRPGHIATTATLGTGYLLIAASAKADSGHTYVFGTQSRMTAGTEARLGLQFTSKQAARENAYGGLQWLANDQNTAGQERWTRHTGVATAPRNTEATRIWLGGFGDGSASASEVAFDTVFLFDLTTLDDQDN